MEPATNNAVLRSRAVRCCSHCGEEGHTIRSCDDDRIRELEAECARRVQYYTDEQFNEFLNTEFETEPTLIRAFAMKKGRATTKTSKEEIIRIVKEYICRTYVYGARDIYDAFNGHSAFRQGEREEVTDLMIRSMTYALRREQILFTISHLLTDFIGEKNNTNNKLQISTTIYNNENENIHNICECSICYDNKMTGDYIKFNCNHEFCKDCVINTIKLKGNKNNICCALCRAEVKTLQFRNELVKTELAEYIE